jgi:hypothetical protein
MEKFFDKVSLRGVFEMRVYKSRKLVEEFTDDNLIMNIAKEQMAHLIAGEILGRYITQIAFGTSNTDPDPTNTVITGQWAKPVLGHSYPVSGRVRFNWELLTSEANGMAIREFGLLTGDDRLFARKIRINSINKESDISVDGSWTIIY